MRLVGLALFSLSLSAFAGTVEDRKDIPEVFQREYIITSSQQTDYVQTYGVYTCVALTLYDRESKIGILTHLDAQTDVEKELPKLVSAIGNNSLEARVFGGLKNSSSDLAGKILKQLKKLNIQVVEKDIYQDSNSSKSVMLELDTGKVFSYIENESGTDYLVAQAKVDRIKFGRRLYRHMESLGGGDPVNIPQKNDDPFGSPFSF